MTTRRKNTKATNANLKFYLSIVLACIVIGSFAYTTCTKNAEDSRVQQLTASADEAELAVVQNAEAPDGLMLHYPGFDVYFSQEHHQPYYVAWVLTPEHAAANDVKRANNFRPDPEVPASAQLGDYRNSGYDRGHMAPSADFRYDQEAQNATFFLTNICPQHTQLNTKAWARLEEQCRNWAKRDSTLIIIAGPVLSDVLSQSIGDDNVTVPDRFFKVVLAPYATPPRAIGFVMPNQYVEGGVQTTAMSVDDVEAITGYDFFSALPDEVEEMIESNAKYSAWQYSSKKKKK